MTALANSLPRPSVIPDGARRDRGRRSDWRVAALRCYEIGLGLRGAPAPAPAPPLAAQPSVALLAEILTAAVCHATNWDTLRATIARRALASQRFTARRLSSLDFEAFRAEFGSAFAADDDLRARHRLFSETAGILHANDRLSLNDMLRHPVRLGGRGGLYERLREISAFGGDPEAKKARILVQELCRTQLIRPLDPEAVRPAIEYHLIRLYLRTERVLPQRWDDEERLQEKAHTFRAPIIMRIRRAVEEAMFFTAAAAELPITTLNQLEWQIARSFCERGRPRCDGPPLPGKPLDPAVSTVADAGGCPHSRVCLGAADRRTARVIEPRLSPRYDYY